MNAIKPFFFFVGRTASGKETQSRFLAEKLQYKIFMTGQRFRDIIASGSELGDHLKETYEKGLLMPSWVADYMFEEFVFNLPFTEGAVFEGSGRDVNQAKVIEEVCAWLNRPYMVLNLEVSEEEVIKRSVGRSRDMTDHPEVIQTRLQEYTKLTTPAIEYFRSIQKCTDINGEQAPEKVHEDVMQAVSTLLK